MGSPEGCLWGAATASYQIEGAVAAAGRRPSIWHTVTHTPGRSDTGLALAATHHLLLGHGMATQALRAERGDRARLGITLNLSAVRAQGDSDADRRAQRLVDGNLNRLYLDPLFEGHYPDDMAQHYPER